MNETKVDPVDSLIDNMKIISSTGINAVLDPAQIDMILQKIDALKSMIATLEMKDNPVRKAMIDEHYKDAMKKMEGSMFMGAPVNIYDPREVIATLYYMVEVRLAAGGIMK